jgi:hypothetical protein
MRHAVKTPIEKFDVTIVSGEMIGTVTVHARGHQAAEREAIKKAERAYPDRAFVSAGATKRGG